jgi:hypothetical protein
MARASWLAPAKTLALTPQVIKTRAASQALGCFDATATIPTDQDARDNATRSNTTAALATGWLYNQT